LVTWTKKLLPGKNIQTVDVLLRGIGKSRQTFEKSVYFKAYSRKYVPKSGKGVSFWTGFVSFCHMRNLERKKFNRHMIHVTIKKYVYKTSQKGIVYRNPMEKIDLDYHITR
jgi:hypothetical protein